MRNTLITAIFVAALIVAGPASAKKEKLNPETNYGFSTSSGVTVPLNTFKGNRFKSNPLGMSGKFKLGASYSVGAKLVLDWFELGYSFTTFQFKSTSTTSGSTLNLSGTPRLQLHKVGLGFRIYLTSKENRWRPYLPLGLGALFGSSSSQHQLDRSYGLDINAGFGLEVRLVKHLYLLVDARYHFNLIVQPAALRKDAILAAQISGLAEDLGKANSIENISGNPVSEALGFFHYLDIRLGLSVRF